MSSIVLILKKIEEKPELYLGEKSLSKLRSFIDGYLTCEQDNNLTNSSIVFQKFIDYFNNQYGLQSYSDYHMILYKEFKSESVAFDKFFELFNKFLNL